MDEYIKREDAVSAICFGCNLEFSDRPCEPPDCEIRHAIEAIRAADVVEVVHCEDCKHYFYYGKTAVCVNGKTIRAGWCQRRARYIEEFRMLPKDFCSYGERKGGAE